MVHGARGASHMERSGMLHISLGEGGGGGIKECSVISQPRSQGEGPRNEVV